MNIEKEREAFVKKYREIYGVDKSLFVNDAGEFYDAFCQEAWLMWQAAKASAQTKITDLEEHNYSLQDKMHDLNALVAVTKANAVPDGYVVVPKEPTAKINNAGLHECRKLFGLGPDDIGYIYKVMIEAAQEQGHE